MNLSVSMKINSKIPEVKEKSLRAASLALRDIVVEVHSDSVKDSPWKTGNNKRSLKFEHEGKTGRVYSTSGYGGYLETGTAKMDPRPYMRPALDRRFTSANFSRKVKDYL